MDTPLYIIPTLTDKNVIKFTCTNDDEHVIDAPPPTDKLAPYVSVVFDGDARPLSFFTAANEPSANGQALRAYVDAYHAYDFLDVPDRPADPPMWDRYKLVISDTSDDIYYTRDR